MSYEMLILAITTLLFMFSWVPASVAKYHVYGLRWLASNRSTEGLPPMPEWAQRAIRAQDNLKENYPGFAVAVLLLAFTGGFTRGTAAAAAIFLAARLVHLPAYIAGAPGLRIFSWAVGFVAMVYLLIMALAALV
ncbi:MAG: MAPEG family protein [Gammaproteobacteria bacterium]|nr:MAPEG family protein [Gammaproteobacteria bacterium]